MFDRVAVDAPGGVVEFSAIDDRKNVGLFGDARMTVTAKQVILPGALDGSARLHATLTVGGELKIDEMRGGSSCIWKRADAKDPQPTVLVARRSPGTQLVDE